MKTKPQISLRQRISVEWLTWASLAFVAALMEGGVLGIIIKNGFEGKVSDWLLNLSVAIATGAPHFSNLVSFYWVKFSRGKSKARLVSNLAVLFCLCTLLMGFVSFDAAGLIALLVVMIIARIAWSGMLTIRSNIWRVNYPRHIRGKVTAKLATLSSLIMSVVGIAVGWLLDWDFATFRWIFVTLAVVATYGSYRYRTLAVRHQQKEIQREIQDTQSRSFSSLLSILFINKNFGKYMLAMFIMGSGNLMMMAPLIVYINEHMSLNQFYQILITTAIPLALIPMFVGKWAAVLDNNHIFHFRSIHCWAFVIAIGGFQFAQLTQLTYLFFVAAICYGIAISGGIIGWNLGHNDFVNQNERDNPMDYMAIHVTLNGLRGLLMPIIGIMFYQWLESNSVGNGKYALFLPFTLVTIGAILFTVFNRQYKISKSRAEDNNS